MLARPLAWARDHADTRVPSNRHKMSLYHEWALNDQGDLPSNSFKYLASGENLVLLSRIGLHGLRSVAKGPGSSANGGSGTLRRQFLHDGR